MNGVYLARLSELSPGASDDTKPALAHRPNYKTSLADSGSPGGSLLSSSAECSSSTS